MEAPDDVLDELQSLAERYPELRHLERRIVAMLEDRSRAGSTLEAVFGGIDHVILVIDAENRTITGANAAVQVVFGYAADEIIGRNTEFLHVDHRHYDIFGRQSAESLGRGETYESEFPLRRRDGSVFPAEITVKAVRISAGSRRAVVSLIHDLSRRKQEEQLLLSNSRKLSTMFDSALDAIVFLDDDARYIDVNPAALRLIGCSREEALTLGTADLMSGEAARDFRERWKSFRETGWSTGENELHARDGRVVTVEFYAVADVLPGVHISINRDISDRKRHERGLERALQEREMLIREVHHRVKNNLQLVSSMLNLQSSRTEAAAEARTLNAARHRIGTIALLYEQLLRNEYVAEVQMDAYLRTLTGFLATLATEVTIELETDPIILDIDRAIPCGLLVNELVTNAVEHAFPESDHGHVMVRLKQVDAGSEAVNPTPSVGDPQPSAGDGVPQRRLELTVCDNGAGIADGIETQNPGTLGLQFVHALTVQLHGRLTIAMQNGTSVRIRFPF